MPRGRKHLTPAGLWLQTRRLALDRNACAQEQRVHCEVPAIGVRRLVTACLAGALVSSCAADSSRLPSPPTPATFEHANTAGDATWPAQEWYRGFGSDELDGLVELAVTNNGDIAAARERVVQADARARQAGAAILPTVAGNANASYLAGHSQQGSGHELDWLAMLSASYEVDFWGKNRATATAARLQAGGSRTDRDAAALTILGAVADEYFQILALRERTGIARANVEATEKILAVVQAR